AESRQGSQGARPVVYDNGPLRKHPACLVARRRPWAAAARYFVRRHSPMTNEGQRKRLIPLWLSGGRRGRWHGRRKCVHRRFRFRFRYHPSMSKAALWHCTAQSVRRVSLATSSSGIVPSNEFSTVVHGRPAFGGRVPRRRCGSLILRRVSEVGGLPQN